MFIMYEKIICLKQIKFNTEEYLQIYKNIATTYKLIFKIYKHNINKVIKNANQQKLDFIALFMSFGVK